MTIADLIKHLEQLSNIHGPETVVMIQRPDEPTYNVTHVAGFSATCFTEGVREEPAKVVLRSGHQRFE